MNQSKLLLIAAIAFVIALIDGITSNASNYHELHNYGKAMCLVIIGIFILWFGLMVYSLLKKRK